MSTFLYPLFKAELLKGNVDLESADLRAIPVTALYTPSNAHEFLDDVGAGARAATAEALSTQVVSTASSKATFDADDLTFPGVAAGDDIVALLVYIHTGTEGTSRLVGYFDYFTNLPITPDTRDVVFSWPNTTDRIFSF